MIITVYFNLCLNPVIYYCSLYNEVCVNMYIQIGAKLLVARLTFHNINIVLCDIDTFSES